MRPQLLRVRPSLLILWIIVLAVSAKNEREKSEDTEDKTRTARSFTSARPYVRPYHLEDVAPSRPYEFSYAVDDRGSANLFSRAERSDGVVVEGEYRTLLPDGRTQIVSYRSDPANGYTADVRYEGTAIPFVPPPPTPNRRKPIPKALLDQIKRKSRVRPTEATNTVLIKATKPTALSFGLPPRNTKLRYKVTPKSTVSYVTPKTTAAASYVSSTTPSPYPHSTYSTTYATSQSPSYTSTYASPYSTFRSTQPTYPPPPPPPPRRTTYGPALPPAPSKLPPIPTYGPPTLHPAILVPTRKILTPVTTDIPVTREPSVKLSFKSQHSSGSHMKPVYTKPEFRPTAPTTITTTVTTVVTTTASTTAPVPTTYSRPMGMYGPNTSATTSVFLPTLPPTPVPNSHYFSSSPKSRPKRKKVVVKKKVPKREESSHVQVSSLPKYGVNPLLHNLTPDNNYRVSTTSTTPLPRFGVIYYKSFPPDDYASGTFREGFPAAIDSDLPASLMSNYVVSHTEEQDSYTSETQIFPTIIEEVGNDYGLDDADVISDHKEESRLPPKDHLAHVRPNPQINNPSTHVLVVPKPKISQRLDDAPQRYVYRTLPSPPPDPSEVKSLPHRPKMAMPSRAHGGHQFRHKKGKFTVVGITNEQRKENQPARKGRAFIEKKSKGFNLINFLQKLL